jgi:group I intron endonuclease
MTGIYCIRNLINGHLYIGSAARDIKKRWRQHRHELTRGKHPNCHLQAAWRFYGEASFRFGILEACLPEECLTYEQHWLDLFNPEYNICRAAGSRLGVKHSETVRLKMITRQRSPEARAHMHEVMKGKQNFLGHKHSPQTKAIMSAIMQGNKHALGSKSNIGRKASTETRRKMGLAHLGNTYCTGHKNHLGYRHSKESLKIMSEKRKQWWRDQAA